MKQATIIKRLQALALARYNQGWDTFVECYTAAEWIEFTTDTETGQPMTWRQALGMAETCASVWYDQQCEARHYREEAREPVEALAPVYDDLDDDDAPPPAPWIFLPHPADADRWPF